MKRGSALVRRQRRNHARYRGRNELTIVPMLDVMGYFNFPDMFQHRTFEGDTSGWKPPQSQVLETSDGYVVISPATRFFKSSSAARRASMNAIWPRVA